MKRTSYIQTFCLIGLLAIFIAGCGGGGGSSSSNTTTSTNDNTSASSIALFLDSPVEGIEYNSASYSGYTDSNGYFNYKKGEIITFNIGNITLGELTLNSNNIVTPLEIINTTDINNAQVLTILRALQSLDNDNNPTNGITILRSKFNELKSANKVNLSEKQTINDSELKSLLNINSLVSITNAKNHFNTSLNLMSSYKDQLSKQESSNITENGYNHDGVDSDGDGSDTDTTSNTPSPTISTIGYTLLAWNDLGMHCFDGKDFSIFSILPPYNNLNAHLIKKDGTSNKHVTTGVTITYQSLDNLGHTNTTSIGKTNFWDYIVKLFHSQNLPDVGLTGNKTPSTTPNDLAYNSTNKWWEATGIPIVSYDDNGNKNYYPMVRVTAKDTSGTTLAIADVVLPVSDEMDCAKCHSSNSTLNDAKPSSGWVNDSDTLKDYKLNILRLHDQKYPNAVSNNQTNLTNAGYTYNNAGLETTALGGTPILCATCHKSNALATSGFGTIKSLTSALHGKHANVKDPNTNLTLNDSTNRTSCYSCHPGGQTECLRGAMGSAKDSNGNQIMQCQNCHGTMSDVGSVSREGWFDQPNCQVCHQNGQRYTSALVSGSLRAVLDDRFATNPNTPMNGKSLYRFSIGHGNLQCSSCHGSTHAIFPTSHLQDNILSKQIQGHSGTIAECSSCHTTVPTTLTGGPHGMHTIGQTWVNNHGNYAESNATQCATCHGSDYKGSVLSKTFTSRTYSKKTYTKGTMVSCYDCHNGPKGE